jgi:hypothetical protein
MKVEHTPPGYGRAPWERGVTDRYTQTTPAYPDWTFEVEVSNDGDMDLPWVEYGDDCHGTIRVDRGARGRQYHWHSKGTGKLAGEVELHYEGGTSWFYDVQGAMKRARKDGWGLGEADRVRLAAELTARRRWADPQAPDIDHRTLTRGQVCAEAVRKDMEYCRDWLRGDRWWSALWVRVKEVPDMLAVLYLDMAPPPPLAEGYHDRADVAALLHPDTPVHQMTPGAVRWLAEIAEDESESVSGFDCGHDKESVDYLRAEAAGLCDELARRLMRRLGTALEAELGVVPAHQPPSPEGADPRRAVCTCCGAVIKLVKDDVDPTPEVQS